MKTPNATDVTKSTKTPILDFVRGYERRGALRLHMPGHKGRGALGVEGFDVTEIDGADSLYEANGIIAESEKNASRLFGSRTYYSTEGSSHCIRAMLFLALSRAPKTGERPLILAGRNAHKVFLSAAALLDFEIGWLIGEGGNYLSLQIDEKTVENALKNAEKKPVAVYLTTPDYLGNVLNVSAIAAVCKKFGVLLLIDNAHGAYLKFLPESLHPVDLGADMCADSAHKTLPVVTGGAYLHLGGSVAELKGEAKNALALFGSTSPSYLILASLDYANALLEEEFPQALRAFLPEVEACKRRLSAHGYVLYGDEPLKIAIRAKSYGYDGREMAAFLNGKNIVAEFSDPDFIVFMLSPATGTDGLHRLEEALYALPKKSVNATMPPAFTLPERVFSVREATFMPRERILAKDGLDRVLATATVACPPAVPVVVCGERINGSAVKLFEYYGIAECEVIKE